MTWNSKMRLGALLLLVCILLVASGIGTWGDDPSVDDFEGPWYNLSRQGTATNPKVVPLIVIGWQPRGKGEPLLQNADLNSLFFAVSNSVAEWFWENSQGRYRIVPHPTLPVIGPLQSVFDWPFYWRNDPAYVRLHLCGSKDSFCSAWNANPFKLPTKPGDPGYYVDQSGKIWFLDGAGFINGHAHSYAEAIRGAAAQINFADFDQNGDGILSQDECLVVIVKAQAKLSGYQRGVLGSEVPPTELRVDNVVISKVAEVYTAPPSSPVEASQRLAVAVEEVLHLAANLADQYPNVNRAGNDPRRPGELALTDAGWRPVHIDPYHKLKWGWLNPQIADTSGIYTLRAAATTGDALILYSPFFGTDEFFILENRWSGNSYDASRSDGLGEGLALWHCIQDPELSSDWGRRAIHLRRANPSLDEYGSIQWDLTLFDGADPARGYDIHDGSSPQNLRFSGEIPSRIRISEISAAGPVMTVRVTVPPRAGEMLAIQGLVDVLRIHAMGTGYGPPDHRIEEDAIVILDTAPDVALGVDLSTPAGQSMLETLRIAMREGRRIRVEYVVTSAIGGRVSRVILL